MQLTARRTQRLVLSFFLGAVFGLLLGIAIHASLVFTNSAGVRRYLTSFEFEALFTPLCAFAWLARTWLETRES